MNYQQLYEEELQRNNSLNGELQKRDETIKRLKINTAELQNRIEEEEEYITNNLLKRLDAVKKEKEVLAHQLEHEEEVVVNTLQKKLDKVRQEKVELENHLEVEQEYIVNKLQKQLMEVTRQKNALERQLNNSRSGLISQLERSVGEARDTLLPSSSTHEQLALSRLEAQIIQMREQQHKIEEQSEVYRKRCDELMIEVEDSNKENFVLAARAEWFKEKLERVQHEREEEFAEEELYGERRFNERRRSQSSNSTSSRSRSASELSRSPGVARAPTPSLSVLTPRLTPSSPHPPHQRV